MPHFGAPRSRTWPSVAVLALIGVSAASCSSSNRFDSNPYASNRSAPQQETTGSIAPRPATTARVEAQPLPAPSRPATVAATTTYSGTATGGSGLGAYRPASQSADVTGSIPERRVASVPPPPPPKPAGAWTWDGGAPVTIGHGETVETIARRYNVPASAIIETNGFHNAAEIKPGQRLVIPRYVTSGAAQHAAVAPAAAPAATSSGVHIVKPGESLRGIAHHYGLSPAEIARANRIEPYAKLNAGDRLNIPGTRPVADARPTPVPQLTQPRTIPIDRVATTTPRETARMATPELAAPPETTVKTAEATGGLPSFRWPVRGRVILAFGQPNNGQPNDGINVSVPEGTPIKAADDGIVAYSGNELKGYGNLVLVRHPNGYVSAYAHASEILVKRGDAIKRGQVIANAGQTGNVTSPQVHFEIRKGSTPVDPSKYLAGL